MRCLPTFVIAIFCVSSAVAQSSLEPKRIEKWEKDVAALEKKQAAKKIEKGGIVFAGSSTIRMWDTDKSFPEWKPVNSGFGGSEIRDVTHFADRLILKHEPKAILFYAGDNDINSKRTPEQVAKDFEAFVGAVRSKLPDTSIYFIGIKPSIERWKQFETQSKANALVKEFCSKPNKLRYVDATTPFLGTDGQPIPEMYVKDGLHLSAKGYETLSAAVKAAVK